MKKGLGIPKKPWQSVFLKLKETNPFGFIRKHMRNSLTHSSIFIHNERDY